MKASDLTELERKALMGLLKLTISADLTLSNEEAQVLARIKDEMGEGAFNYARDQARAALKTIEDVERSIIDVEREEARQLIYGLALEAATSDGLIAKELRLLLWTAKRWGIAVDPETGQLT